ncbi:MAG: flagellar protein FlgN [Halanaerobiales bacterium]
MDQSIYKELAEVLNKEYKEYLKLNDLAQSKKDTIVNNDVEQLGELIKDDSEIISKINELEKERSRIIGEICRNNNLASEDINFTQLINVIPEPWKDELCKVRNQLLEVIDELHTQNEQNKYLVTEALKLNNASLNIFINALQPENKTYNMKQKKLDSKSSHIIDRRG